MNKTRRYDVAMTLLMVIFFLGCSAMIAVMAGDLLVGFVSFGFAWISFIMGVDWQNK